MTHSIPDHQPTIPSLQQDIISETVEEWEYLTEDEDEENYTFAEALKGWYDTQLQELHDSRGDADYQSDIIKMLRAFPRMIQQIREMDFGFETLEEEIAIETLPEEEYSARLQANIEANR